MTPMTMARARTMVRRAASLEYIEGLRRGMPPSLRLRRRIKLHRALLRILHRRGCLFQEIINGARSPHHTAARHEMIIETRRQYPDWSLSAIARIYNLDQSSVKYALVKAGVVSGKLRRVGEAIQ